MIAKIEFHFDFGSPNAYLSHRVIPAIEERTAVKFDYIPVLIGGLFKATNNKSPMEAFHGVKNKNEYNSLESERFKKKHGIDNFKMNPFFPVNTLHIMRGAIYAQQAGIGERYINEVYSAMWEQELNMGDTEVIAKVLNDAGLPADEIIAGTQDAQLKQKLIDNTSASVERGNFGSPTFFVGNEMYFGKDRLLDVEGEIEFLKCSQGRS